jgi:hypothetical protein
MPRRTEKICDAGAVDRMVRGAGWFEKKYWLAVNDILEAINYRTLDRRFGIESCAAESLVVQRRPLG